MRGSVHIAPSSRAGVPAAGAAPEVTTSGPTCRMINAFDHTYPVSTCAGRVTNRTRLRMGRAKKKDAFHRVEWLLGNHEGQPPEPVTDTLAKKP